MRPFVRALFGGALILALAAAAPGAGRAAGPEPARSPVPETQSDEKDVGLSPAPSFATPSPEFEREASFVGASTGDAEHDTYGYRVSGGSAPAASDAKR